MAAATLQFMLTKFRFLIACLFFLILLTDTFAQSSDQPRLVVKTGHSNKVTSVAFSPDGKTLASGSWDNTIKLWEVSNGQEFRALLGHSNYVSSITFSPDGKILASGSWDNSVKLWDVISGQELRSLNGHSKYVTSVAFSPDGKMVASASEDHTVRLWSTTSDQEVHRFEHLHKVNSVAFSPDGKTLASASDDRTVRLWHVATGDEFRLLTHPAFVKTLAFSPDGKTLASGSDDNTIRLWAAESGQELGMLTGHTSSLIAIAFSPDSKTLASSGWDKTVRLWNVTRRKQSRILEQTNFVNAVTFSPNGEILATAGRDKAIKLWHLPDGKDLETLAGHSSIVSSVAFSSNGKMLASGGWDKAIKLWNLEGSPQLTTLTGHNSYVNCVAFRPDGRMLASGSWDKTIKLWDLSRPKEPRTLTGHARVVRSVAFSSDGKTVASGSDDNTIKLWDVASGQELRTLAKHSDMVRSVAFSPDGNTLASGSWDKTIRLWNVATGEELRTLEGHSNKVTAVAFSTDGKTLASGGWDKKIKLWDVATGKVQRTLEGHSAGVYSIAFSADGKTLASGSDDNTIKLWDLTSGQELKTLGGQWVVYSVAFSPDGNTLATAGGGARVRLWSRAGDSTRTEKELASLIALDERDWAVVTPEGLFDASPNAEKLMHWRVRNEFIDLEQLKERYYEPWLLAKLTGFNKEPIHDVSALRNVKMFPNVEFAQPDPNGRLTINIANRGGGIGKIRVLVNGKEIAADARGASPKPEASQARLTVDLAGASIIPGQANSVEVIAWNAEGSLSSRGVKIRWTPPGAEALAARRPDFYAIIVGISKYTGGSFDLKFAAKDAEDMSRALQIAANGLFGTDKTHITLLNTSGKEGIAPPTKTNIRNAFESVAKQAKPWDVLVIYLSGHGMAMGGTEDIYLYPTHEARTLDAETLKDTALREVTTISSEELTEWLTKIEWVPGQKGLAPLKRVIILDTCAAGKAAEKLTRDPANLSSAQIRAISRLEGRTGYHILMGSAADAVSYEANQYGQGLLTYSLLQGMRGAALREDQYVDVALLFNYSADEVPKLALNIGGIQRPIIAARDATSFDVGLLKSKEEKSAIPLAQLKAILLRPALINRDENVGFDDLEVVPLLRERLRAESELNARAGTQDWISVYVNADDMVGAVRPSGFYSINEDTVRVTINLVRDLKRIDGFQVEGNKGNKDALVALIVDGIAKTLKKHEAELLKSP